MPATADYNYTTDAGNIFKVRMDSDTVLDTIRGNSSTEQLTENMHLQIQKNDREYGMSPRYTLFGRKIGAESAGTTCLLDTGKRYKQVVSLTEDAFDAIVTGAIDGANVTNFTQNGATYWALVKNDEKRR